MKELKFNLIRNLTPETTSDFTVKQIVRMTSDEEFIQLAREEVKAIQYFVKIEFPDWNYWKNKEQKLMELIIKLKTKTNENKKN